MLLQTLVFWGSSGPLRLEVDKGRYAIDYSNLEKAREFHQQSKAYKSLTDAQEHELAQKVCMPNTVPGDAMAALVDKARCSTNQRLLAVEGADGGEAAPSLLGLEGVLAPKFEALLDASEAGKRKGTAKKEDRQKDVGKHGTQHAPHQPPPDAPSCRSQTSKGSDITTGNG